MIDALSSAQSGMAAAIAQLGVAAHNIANANTPGFQAQSVNLVPQVGGGVAVDGTSTSKAPTEQDGSNVDLAAQAVNISQAKLLYNANASVVHVADQMYGTLINILDNQDRDRDGDKS